MPRPRLARSRTLHFALVTGLGLALTCVLSTGCRRAETPVPEERYQVLGPKPDLPAYLKGTIYEAVDVHGTQTERISGYGVVVNLENTGRDDGIPTAVREYVLAMAGRLGIGSQFTDGSLGSLSTQQFLADPRTAIVRVDAYVPPGARPGQRIDVRVTTLDSNTTTSLARGELYQTELHRGIVTPQSPGERVNKAGTARGRLMVNPVYALEDPTLVKEDAAARESLRVGYIPGGAMFDGQRSFILRLREPSYRTSRGIEKRINLHFGRPVAAAQDEGTVALVLPENFEAEDWPRFLAVATRLYGSIEKAFAVERAEALAAEIQKPGLTPLALDEISYTWEGLGQVAMPTLVPLFSHPDPGVAFAAARAAAYIGEPAALDALVQQAGQPQNPYGARAAEALGRLTPTPLLARSIRSLLLQEDPAVRIAAYQSLLRVEQRLARTEGRSISSIPIGRQGLEQFYLDLVPSRGRPVIWASRQGTPRIAVIGPRPELKVPMIATAFRDRLTIHAESPERATIFYRPVNGDRAVADVEPTITELVARLGGSAPPGRASINLAYGDVLAVLRQLSDAGQIVADGRPVSLILEDPAADVVDEAPVIPGLEDLTAQAPERGGADSPPPVAGVSSVGR